MRGLVGIIWKAIRAAKREAKKLVGDLCLLGFRLKFSLI